jgi:hypothetical protein
MVAIKKASALVARQKLSDQKDKDQCIDQAPYSKSLIGGCKKVGVFVRKLPNGSPSELSNYG